MPKTPPPEPKKRGPKPKPPDELQTLHVSVYMSPSQKRRLEEFIRRHKDEKLLPFNYSLSKLLLDSALARLDTSK